MIFEQIYLETYLKNFTYVIGDEGSKKAAVFDPSSGHELISEVLDKNSLSLEYIIHTHGHSDHTGGTSEFQKERGGKVVSHPSLGPDIPVKHEDILSLGSLVFKFFYTPGHTEDSICILAEDLLITGDTLFVGKVGGTSTSEQAQTEYNSLHEVIMKLPASTRIYPGHDYGIKPSSTIAEERETNPFLLQTDFEAFLYLKNTWAEYKEKHGIS